MYIGLSEIRRIKTVEISWMKGFVFVWLCQWQERVIRMRGQRTGFGGSYYVGFVYFFILIFSRGLEIMYRMDMCFDNCDEIRELWGGIRVVGRRERRAREGFGRGYAVEVILVRISNLRYSLRGQNNVVFLSDRRSRVWGRSI